MYLPTKSYQIHDGIFVLAVIAVTHEWLSALERGQDNCADYRIAFDSVHHLPLLGKLECLGLNAYYFSLTTQEVARKK